MLLEQLATLLATFYLRKSSCDQQRNGRRDDNEFPRELRIVWTT